MANALLSGLAERAARELHLDERARAEVSFGLQLLAYGIADVAVAVAFGWLLGVLSETLLILAAAASLKRFAGGAHAATPAGCALVTAAACGLFGKLAQWGTHGLTPAGQFVLLLLSIFALLAALLRYAPADVAAKPIRRPERRARLRRQALALWAAWALSGLLVWATQLLPVDLALAIAFVLAWQALLLTPLGYRIFAAAPGSPRAPGRAAPRGEEV